MEVPVTTLDHFARTRTRPSVIKVDVEGAEAEVIEGAQELLQLGAKFLIELHSRGAARDVLRTLARVNYRLVTLDGRPSFSPETEHHLIALPANVG